MKKLLVTSGLILVSIVTLFTISSCNKKNAKSLEGYTNIQIPKQLKSYATFKSSSETIIPKEERVVKKDFILNQNNKVLYGTQIITLDKYGNMIKLEISNNIFDKSNLQPDFLLQYYKELSSQKNSNFKSTLGIDSCLHSCQSVKHPGWCKAGCWAELVIKAAAVVIAAIKL